MPKVQIWEGIIGSVYHSEQATMGHLYIEAGVSLPSHQHPHEQWSHLIFGRFEFVIGEETIVLEAGQSVYIAPNVPHSGRCLEACKFIDCFVPVREDWKNLPQVP